jgi:hypothetical protein
MSSSSCAALSPSLRTQLFNPFPNRFISPARLYQHRKPLHSLSVFSVESITINLFEYLSVFEGSSKCEMSRRGFAFKGIVASGVSVMGSSLITEPAQGLFFLFLFGFEYLLWLQT